MRTHVVASIIVELAILALASFIGFHLFRQDSDPGSALAAQLAACNAYPNNSTQSVVETSRLTIYLPKRVYPNQSGLLTFKNASGTAAALWISNGGLPGNAIGASAECFADYYELDGKGEVDLVATSSVPGAPTYIVHFLVRSNPH